MESNIGITWSFEKQWIHTFTTILYSHMFVIKSVQLIDDENSK